jgi:hypothetical protein|tara:strand:- start:21269 stop:21466 length:198 start_codon:yes stop_codon:yes gene_type:complete
MTVKNELELSLVYEVLATTTNDGTIIRHFDYSAQVLEYMEEMIIYDGHTTFRVDKIVLDQFGREQ